jgi:four helix bundle protein
MAQFPPPTLENTMSHAPELLKERTKQYAIRVINLVQSLPAKRVAAVVGDQLLRSGTSVGANYRSACRARSPAEFCAKMGIVEEELDESLYWMELVIESKLVSAARLGPLMKEGEELLAMTVASINTARSRKQR